MVCAVDSPGALTTGGGRLLGLTGQYLSLLIAVQENPFGTIDQIAKAAEVSKPTAVKRIKELQGLENGRAYFSVTPLLNYYNLGLETVDVLLETPDAASTQAIERVAKAHPYTVYRCRCYGSVNGVLLQFNPPLGTSGQVKELVRRLKKQGLVDSTRFLTTDQEPTIYSTLKIKGWDPKTLTWKFDWDAWFASAAEDSPRPMVRHEKPGQALTWLTKNDLEVIYELMNGARRKNREIIDALAKRGIRITPQTFSRRLQSINEQCIEGYRVVFDPAAFDIYSNIIVFGRGNAEYLQRVRNRMRTNPIPFESTMRISGEELFWFLRLQPTHLSPLLTSLFSNLTETSICLVDYTHAFLYNIWPETLDEEQRMWRTDRSFMVDDVLRDAGVEQ
ncbi:MAG: Lrp/AsnC family transcriptional regulator [Candidatus Thorarchaeota archaeon]|nr:Lrp/AsnC family transcriptional regulator [Candidatus Thorarchaeota archaeon]